MKLLIGLGMCGIMLLVIYWLGRGILGPIDRAAKARRAAVRFSLSDFLCLFVVVQLPLTLVSRLKSDETEGLFWFFTVLAWVIAPIIWTACAVSLSRAGITSGKHRIVFMGLVLPIVYYGLTPFVLMAGIAITMLLIDGDAPAANVWLVAGWLLTGAALAGCGRYTRWLTRPRGDESVTDDGEPRPSPGGPSPLAPG